MNKFLMDAHMHFDLYKNRDDILKYIENQKSYTIAVTNLPELYECYFKKYDNYKYIKIALGFHPELVLQYKNQLPLFFKHIDDTRYIGEVGLDFTTKDEIDKETQCAIFKRIVDSCQGRNKILSVHSRRAENECLKILEDFDGKVILHWFSGNVGNLNKALKRGYYFSVNHQMLLSKNGRQIIDLLPIERILIESDAPFTTGLDRKYNLSFVDNIYEYLSKKKEVSILEISLIVKNNFRKLLS